MPLGDKVRQLDEHVAAVVRRAVEDLREEVRKRLDEATDDLRRRLGEVAPELPASFVNEEDLRQIAEEATTSSDEALAAAETRGAHAARAALREAAEVLDRATTQGGVLDALLAESARFAPRAAILLARDHGIVGWEARGFEADRNAARAVSLSSEEEPWRPVVQGGASRMVPAGRCASLASQLDSPLPTDGVLIPLVLRDRVAALLYADRTEPGQAIDLDALQLLTYAAGLALETLAFRERPSTVTLHPAEGAPAAAPEPSAAGEIEPEPAELETGSETGWESGTGWEAEAGEPASPALDEAEETSWSVDTGGWDEEIEPGAETASFAPAEVLEPVEEPVEIEAVDEVEIELEGAEELVSSSDLLQPVEEEPEPAARTAAGFESIDERVIGEGAFAEAPELEAPATPALETAGDAAEPQSPAEAIPWRTEEPEELELERAEVEPAEDEEGGVAAGGYETGLETGAGATAPAAEHEEAEPAATAEPAEPRTDEEQGEDEVTDRPEEGAVPPPAPRPPSIGPVEPPSDVEGPGWAFSSSRAVVAKGEEATHEEARRLARLLVSEILLYNQDEVEEGRRNRDIYERLRDDIERSRQLYEDRVETSVRDSTDYFYQELVRQLAKGDAKALGI